ncbi:MAG: hypothetical protein KF901_30075 [Myxococcales bacterium]|nr:hypothetical protein [Myxococcales bacterium]
MTRLALKTLLALALCVVWAGCADEESFDPAYLGGSEAPPPQTDEARAPAAGEAPRGRRRMANLPAAPTPEQEAQIARLVQESGGGGGGRTSPELQPFVDYGRRAESMPPGELMAAANAMLNAGSNVIGPDVTPCDRLIAMASVAARETGAEPQPEDQLRRMCAQIPPAMLACIQPDRSQTAEDRRRCQLLFGATSFFEKAPPDETRPRPRRPQSEEDVRRMLGGLFPGPARQAPERVEPRDEPLLAE